MVDHGGILLVFRPCVLVVHWCTGATLKAHGAEGVGEFGLLGVGFQGGQVRPQQPGTIWNRPGQLDEPHGTGEAQKRWTKYGELPTSYI